MSEPKVFYRESSNAQIVEMVEKSAYDQLCDENEKLKSELESKQQTMESLNLAFSVRITELKAERDRLKALADKLAGALEDEVKCEQAHLEYEPDLHQHNRYRENVFIHSRDVLSEYRREVGE